MKGITQEEWAPYHRQVLHALSSLAQNISSVHTHSAGIEYTSLMSCFLMHNVSGARSLLALYDSAGADWFPVTVGYTIARSIFEIDVTAHYITLLPQERSSQYILFEHVLNKQAMDICNKYRKSNDPSWRVPMEIEWQEKWADKEHEINSKFSEVRPKFTFTDRKGKEHLFQNWSGKSIRDLADEVQHKEAYDTFYSDLSSFTHGDVRLANRFLRIQPDCLQWTQRANPFDAGKVLHDASSFLTCYLKLFGSQFHVWNSNTVEACWNTNKTSSWMH